MTVYEHLENVECIDPDFITKSGWLTSLGLYRGNSERWREGHQWVALEHGGLDTRGDDSFLVTINLDSVNTTVRTDRLNRARQIFHAAVMSTIEPDEYEPRLARLLEAHS